MARSDRGRGPRIAMRVIYNNAGTKVPAIIYAVSATNGTVSLVYFNASGATAVTGVGFDANARSGTWNWAPW